MAVDHRGDVAALPNLARHAGTGFRTRRCLQGCCCHFCYSVELPKPSQPTRAIRLLSGRCVAPTMEQPEFPPHSFASPIAQSSIVDQSNNELTDCSACVKRIALERSSPTDSTHSLLGRRSSGSAIVSVTATSLIGASFRRARAGPESSACVAQI